MPVVWPNDEICRITGKTVYDVEADVKNNGEPETVPDLLKFCVNKTYKFTILLTKENINEGSNVYNAITISETMEMSATHSPKLKEPVNLDSTQATIVSNSKFVLISCFY